mmetsp:Transcript_118388/g.252750  ORF Transcript_118388/g.252750 Transcript_118388/m.252750 type:complete len:137 (-) Transcript_118388:6-416(-)
MLSTTGFEHQVAPAKSDDGPSALSSGKSAAATGTVLYCALDLGSLHAPETCVELVKTCVEVPSSMANRIPIFAKDCTALHADVHSTSMAAILAPKTRMGNAMNLTVNVQHAVTTAHRASMAFNELVDRHKIGQYKQ